jgi:hypothetical protein
MSEKKEIEEIVFINPLANSTPPKEKMSRKDIEVINLELRRGNNEVIKIENKTHLETKKNLR